MASLPLRFSSSSWWACLKGSLKKFFLSISFRFLRLLIRSARRSLASLCLRSSHNSLRPSFSSGAAFLLLFFRWRLSDMSNSMCLSLRPFCLGAMVCLDVHSPNLSLHSSYMMFPIKVSLCSTVPHKECCSTPLRCSSSLHQTSCIFAFGHLILMRLSGCLRWLPGCVTCEGTVRISLSRLASFSFICWGCPLSTVRSCCAMVCYQALGPFRLTCRSSVIVLVGRHPTLHPPLMYPQASEWRHILPPACSTCRGTSHCNYQFRSLPCDPSK